ncbi:MAG: protein translocase subunit SecF [Chloroflexota bacterium]|nr:protein translocase subunit SecF [Chloroflexota bacterium]
MINIVAKRMWFLSASTIILIVGILSLLFPPHLNLGIDFLSGTGVTVKFENDINSSQIESQFNKIGLDSPSIQSMGDKTFFIRTEKLSDFDVENNDSTVSRSDLEKSIEEIDSDAEIIEIESVGTKVAEGTIRNSIIAVSVASFFVMLYVLYAFRRLEKSYRFAFSAVLTLVHDVVLVTGFYALLGHIFGLQVNSVFIVALLTVIGYSVNDTIVIFDRIRENQIKFPDNKYSSNINISINESIIRSLGTSITTLLVLFSMLVLGGSTLREFIVVLILGVIVGTYSSIFIASQFLIIWEEGIKKK